MENRTPPHTPRDAACARARTPKPDGRRRRASDGLNQRTPLRLGRRPPFPPLPSAARNVSPAEVVVDAVAVMPAEAPRGRPMRLRSIERCTSAGRKPGDESSGGVMSCARKRSAALARAPACRGRAWEAESRYRAREEAGVRGARVRQCSSGGGGSDGSYLCTRHRRDATVSSASMRTPRREGDCAKLPSRLPRNRKYP